MVHRVQNHKSDDSSVAYVHKADGPSSKLLAYSWDQQDTTQMHYQHLMEALIDKC